MLGLSVFLSAPIGRVANRAGVSTGQLANRLLWLHRAQPSATLDKNVFGFMEMRILRGFWGVSRMDWDGFGRGMERFGTKWNTFETQIII